MLKGIEKPLCQRFNIPTGVRVTCLLFDVETVPSAQVMFLPRYSGRILDTVVCDTNIPPNTA